MQTTVTIDSASGAVTMSRGAWSQSFPVADLSRWIAFYRGQMERYPAHAACYADDVRALEELRLQK